MAYRIQAGETADAAFRRIAREQLQGGIDDVEDPDLDLASSVHEVRKRCKKLRGLVRLVRPAFPGYARENAWLRDHARTLSDLRDATSLIECVEALEARFTDPSEHADLASVKGVLGERRRALCDSLDGQKRVEAVRDALRTVLDRVGDWELEAEDFEAFDGGLAKVYKRARKGMRRARAEPSIERLHEWRKRAKYHRYHVALLRELWPDVMSPVHEDTKRVTDRLGDDHDLALLRATLVRDADAFEPSAADRVLCLIERRQPELRARAFADGRRLFGETPKAMRKRVRRLWEAWTLDQQLASTFP